MRSTRGRGGAQKLAAAIAADPKLRQRIREAPNRVYLYDKGSPSVKARRARYRNEFLLIMRGVLEIDPSMPDMELHKQVFGPDTVVDNVISYIDAIAGSPEGYFPGRFGKMKAATLRQRTEALWWFAGWEAKNRASEVWTAWNHQIPQALHHCAVRYDLGTARYVKEYFGVPELRLLFSIIFDRTRYVDWYKQHYVAWVMAFITGVRPGTLALSSGYTDTSKEVQAIKWRDVHFLHFLDKPGIFLRIHYKWLKGQRDPHHPDSSGFKGADFLIHPCREPENLVVDLTWLLLCLALERGLFGPATLEKLLNSPISELKQDPIVSQQAIFLSLKGPNNTELDSSNPLRANMLNPPLQRTAHAAGLAVRVTMYVFRREFITTMGRNLSVEEAKTLATHRSAQLGSYGRYDFGMGDLSVAEVVTGESADISEAARKRNKYRRRIASAAINRRADYPEEEANIFVAQKVQESELLVSFEETLRLLLDTARDNFAIENSTTVKHSMEALKAISSEEDTDQWRRPVEMDRYDPSAYTALMDTVYAKGASQVASFLTEFLKARKYSRAWIIRAAHKSFEREWTTELNKPSNQQITERLSESVTVPVILQMPEASAKRKASQLSDNANIRESQESRALEQEKFESADLGLDVDEIEALDLTAIDDATYQEMREEGANANEEADDQIDDDDEIDPDMFDALDIAQAGGTLTAYLPGEEGSDESSVNTPKDSGVAGENEDPTLIAEYYDMARKQCIDTYFRCKEVHRGECICMLCKFNVAGEYQHAFLRQKPTGVVYESAYKWNRHIRGTLHNVEECQFALWAHDRAKNSDGSYICPLNGCTTRTKFRRLPPFRAHVKSMHGSFYERLQH